MKLQTLLFTSILLFAVLTFNNCQKAVEETENTQNDSQKNNSLAKSVRNEPINPLPDVPKIDKEKLALGKKLFHEVKLSGDNSISCASCHQLSSGGVDNRKVSLGIKGRKGLVNAPSVFNTSHNFKQFWDGRANTLEEQIDGPVHNDFEMGSNWKDIVSKLKKDTYYQEKFNQVYQGNIDETNIKDALATFQQSLASPSRFDEYLLGKDKAITAKELQGYHLFKKYGCTACHQGINVGGNMFQKFGVVGNYFEDRGNIQKSDYGRYNVTQNELDKFVFKVPSLRNITLTAPYFHDGSAKTLQEAIEVMAKYQLGRQIPEEDITLMITFLKSLTGKDFE